MNLEQLRAASVSGGVTGVTLKGEGGAFFVRIRTRGGPAAVLAKARSREPRRFGNPAAALRVLRNIGITAGEFDAAKWDPAERLATAGNRGRRDAMRQAHQAAAYTKWLASEVEAAIADPRTSIPHEEVMVRMKTAIATGRAGTKARRKRS